MNLRAYCVIKRLKAIVYCMVFIAIGLSLLRESGDGRLSLVAKEIEHTYPITTFSLFFIASGLLNLYIGFKDYDWHLFGFAVLYVYTIAVFIAYVDGAAPFAAVPVYVGLSISTSFDVAMDVFVLPQRGAASRRTKIRWKTTIAKLQSDSVH